MAKEYVDSHNLPVSLITITSWNEWTKTSYLEPDTKYGYGYLSGGNQTGFQGIISICLLVSLLLNGNFSPGPQVWGEN